MTETKTKKENKLNKIRQTKTRNIMNTKKGTNLISNLTLSTFQEIEK